MTQPEQISIVKQHDESSALESAETSVSLDALLVSFQSLQTKMTHLTASIAFSLGIGESDLLALIFIANADGATPKQTGDFVVLSSGAVTNLVDRLVAADLVERTPNPRDRRSLMLNVTPAGAAAVGSIADRFRHSFTDSVRPEYFTLLASTFAAIGASLTRTAEHVAGPA